MLKRKFGFSSFLYFKVKSSELDSQKELRKSPCLMYVLYTAVCCG